MYEYQQFASTTLRLNECHYVNKDISFLTIPTTVFFL